MVDNQNKSRRYFWSVCKAVTQRNLGHAFKNPVFLLPSVLFPSVFLLAFAGGLSSLQRIPNFNYPAGYTAFQYTYVILQSAAFGGVFTGFAIAQDFDSGFARRLLVSIPKRSGLIAGYLVAAITRTLFVTSFVTVIALLSGMNVKGTVPQLIGLFTLVLLVSVAATLFGLGFSFRSRTVQSGSAMQVPLFLALFLAPVYVPLHLLTGWIEIAAKVNPMTAIIQAARGFVTNAPQTTALGFAAAIGFVGLLLVYALLGLRKATRSE